MSLSGGERVLLLNHRMHTVCLCESRFAPSFEDGALADGRPAL